VTALTYDGGDSYEAGTSQLADVSYTIAATKKVHGSNAYTGSDTNIAGTAYQEAPATGLASLAAVVSDLVKHKAGSAYSTNDSYQAGYGATLLGVVDQAHVVSVEKTLAGALTYTGTETNLEDDSYADGMVSMDAIISDLVTHKAGSAYSTADLFQKGYGSTPLGVVDQAYLVAAVKALQGVTHHWYSLRSSGYHRFTADGTLYDGDSNDDRNYYVCTSTGSGVTTTSSSSGHIITLPAGCWHYRLDTSVKNATDGTLLIATNFTTSVMGREGAGTPSALASEDLRMVSDASTVRMAPIHISGIVYSAGDFRLTVKHVVDFDQTYGLMDLGTGTRNDGFFIQKMIGGSYEAAFP
jgi:hypothetical protein